MTVNVNLGTDVIDVIVADTTILNNANRVSIGAMNLQNNAVVDRTVTFYISPDLTSAAGKIVSVVTVAAGKDRDINAIIGQGYTASKNIITTASGVDTVLTTTFNTYTDEDA